MNTHAVVCNEIEGTPSVAPGALGFVRQYSSATQSVLIDVMNREGRWITLWRPFGELTNFRTKFLPPKHPKIIWARPETASRAKVTALLAALSSPTTGATDSVVDLTDDVESGSI
jgi:hypothetical protein